MQNMNKEQNQPGSARGSGFHPWKRLMQCPGDSTLDTRSLRSALFICARSQSKQRRDMLTHILHASISPIRHVFICICKCINSGKTLRPNAARRRVRREREQDRLNLLTLHAAEANACDTPGHTRFSALYLRLRNTLFILN